MGGLLAARLGWVFCDGDELPVGNVARMRGGRPLSEAYRGPWLDAVRAWVSARAAAEGSGVIACSALRRRYRDHLRYQDHLRDRDDPRERDDPRAGADALWFLHLDPPPQGLAALGRIRLGPARLGELGEHLGSEGVEEPFLVPADLVQVGAGDAELGVAGA